MDRIVKLFATTAVTAVALIALFLVFASTPTSAAPTGVLISPLEISHEDRVLPESPRPCMTPTPGPWPVGDPVPPLMIPGADADGSWHRPNSLLPEAQQVPFPTDPLSDWCEAIEEGCIKGCTRGAELLVMWGLLDEGEKEGYVEECMEKHCDSPCKPK